MSRRTLLMILLSALLLMAFLVGVMAFERTQTAKEQAYLASASAYIPPETTTVPPTTQPVMAPEFAITDQEDNVYTLADFVGLPTMLCFWDMDSADAKAELAFWNRIAAEYEEQINVVVIHVNEKVAKERQVLKYIGSCDYSFTPYFDNSAEAAAAYEIETLPTAYFINAQGEMKARAKGRLNEDSLAVGLERIGITVIAQTEQLEQTEDTEETGL